MLNISWTDWHNLTQIYMDITFENDKIKRYHFGDLDLILKVTAEEKKFTLNVGQKSLYLLNG